MPLDQVSVHFARKPPSGGFFIGGPSRTASFSDFATPVQPLRLFEQKRQFKLQCSKLFHFEKQSTITPHIGEYSRTNIDNISALAGNFCMISRVVGEF
ncbi:hypothetical protein [Paraburkholderia aromaticivorans]|uniref:hypothetical protein n=1 Tax=Paraburkholderia aromaticivorans TaxID=2026199 RepID=UPI001455F165|nr:hypothetical protein [Paraburkholderia aromaticivorans]